MNIPIPQFQANNGAGIMEALNTGGQGYEGQSKNLANKTAQTNLNTLDGMNKARMSYLNSAAFQEQTQARIAPQMAAGQLLSAYAALAGPNGAKDAATGAPIINGRPLNLNGLLGGLAGGLNGQNVGSGGLPSYDQFMQAQNAQQSPQGGGGGLLGLLGGALQKLTGGGQSQSANVSGQIPGDNLPMSSPEVNRLKGLFGGGGGSNYMNAINPNSPGYTGGGMPSDTTNPDGGSGGGSTSTAPANVSTATMPATDAFKTKAQESYARIQNIDNLYNLLKKDVDVGDTTTKNDIKEKLYGLGHKLNVVDSNPVAQARNDQDALAFHIGENTNALFGINSVKAAMAVADHWKQQQDETAKDWHQRTQNWMNALKSGSLEQMQQAGLGVIFPYEGIKTRIGEANQQSSNLPSQKQSAEDFDPVGELSSLRALKEKGYDINKVFHDNYTDSQQAVLQPYLTRKK